MKEISDEIGRLTFNVRKKRSNEERYVQKIRGIVEIEGGHES